MLPKGFKHSKETIEKIRAASTGRKKSEDERRKISAANYKGDNLETRSAIHKRVEQMYGKPRYCEICKRTDKKMYEWSNKDHTYIMPIRKEDWQRLCCSCHRKYDFKKFGPSEKQKNLWVSMVGRKTRPHTEETKLKIGKGNRGKVISDETRRKMSISAKSRIITNQ